MLSNIHGHTIDESLLTDGVIIDVGCRDFKFSDHFKGKPVYCIDPDSSVFDNVPSHVNTINAALSNYSGNSSYYRNGEMTVLSEIYKGWDHSTFDCKVMTMDELYMITGRNVDLLKLDCEGAEYLIINKDFQPIPKQISIEFHRHMYPDLHEREYQNVMDILLQNYDLVYQHETLMDCLFVRK